MLKKIVYKLPRVMFEIYLKRDTATKEVNINVIIPSIII